MRRMVSLCCGALYTPLSDNSIFQNEKVPSFINNRGRQLNRKFMAEIDAVSGFIQGMN